VLFDKLQLVAAQAEGGRQKAECVGRRPKHSAFRLPPSFCCPPPTAFCFGPAPHAESGTISYHRQNADTERMEKLLAKVEAYFGTTGLDYDN
jgi:hypothetical protein